MHDIFSEEFWVELFWLIFESENFAWTVLFFFAILIVKHVYKRGFTFKNFSVKAEIDLTDPVTTVLSFALSDFTWGLCEQDTVLFVYDTKATQVVHKKSIEDMAEKNGFIAMHQVGSKKRAFGIVFGSVARPVIILVGNQNRSMVLNRILHIRTENFALALLSEFHQFLGEGAVYSDVI